MPQRPFDLNARKVLLTGAGSGIGRSLAVELARFVADSSSWSDGGSSHSPRLRPS